MLQVQKMIKHVNNMIWYDMISFNAIQFYAIV